MKVGIIGSGQLGWMMIIEGRKLQNSYYVLDDKPGPAARLADSYIPVSEYKKFVDACDIVTFEFEHVSEQALLYAEKKDKLRPGIDSVSLKRDRAAEKEFLSANGIPVAEYSISDSREDALKSARAFGKAVIKSSRGGYDGKGQFYYNALGKGGKIRLPAGERFVVEEFIDFDFEASVIASRGEDGTKRFHIPSFNRNVGGILFFNEAPFRDYGMRDVASKILDALEYVGVMGVEFFIRGGRCIVNEIAPRVHNTGHHTLHGSSISQFEQHLRTITGLPVPEPLLYKPSGIVNAVGVEITREKEERLMRIPETHSYPYGKGELRRRRKMGHVNVNAHTVRELRERRRRVIEILYGSEPEAYFLP
ncbi:MAG: 5-(carboxyamino)imidazole ribonucleotide synthase [Thermoplasmata archaeon]|uniref:N5-carboxyaminoimidazole ribonucleotide synthase n=1 Tax=Candidatus Sysuiplasma superficiale TaxID=2823368 RepID=A0A8J7YSE9_9ARCH|nr:5-(carboxyamino)imidazole ribonucleotide synthase [Candidatus Sysuiplasma superficiale]MBX8643232.1 5-(carboxyamino)imidazole ribonucleotide synthase [Candidatus Sysuiplasma superficiale]MCL4347362.1 5-(carboxyamino)imidazole ribonucleotide synthase [Candidatus Thermoplasmatota archaeon]MCL5437189.1 5-(carboxyamino)imidazole ribonucleotide synthase [Candidatus Thermoplasmatota archaeon]